MDYKKISDLTDNTFIRRVSGLLTRWGKIFGEEDAQKQLDIIMNGALDTFQETVLELLVFSGMRSFYQYKRGIAEFLLWAGEIEGCADVNERAQYVRNVQQSSIWTQNGELVKDMQTERFISLSNITVKTSKPTTSSADEPIEGVRFIANPKHLVKILRDVYGDYPDSLCAALCLSWMGIRVPEAVTIKKTDVGENCQSFTFKHKRLIVEDPIRSYLCLYQQNTIEYLPDKNVLYERYKDSEFFLERVMFEKTGATVRNPMLSAMVYAKMKYLNVILTETYKETFALGTDSIYNSGLYYAAYMDSQKTQFAVRETLYARTNGNRRKVAAAMMEFPMWLETYEKVTTADPSLI